MAATLVMPGKHATSLRTSCIASPVYDPAEKPRIQYQFCSPPVLATAPGAGNWLSTAGSYLGGDNT